MLNKQQFKQSSIYYEIIQGKMMHSIMLIGADDKMLDIYAQNIITTLFCVDNDKPCGKCINCQKILHNTFVDVCTFPQNGEVLKSDELSRMLDTVYEMPFESDKKVYVINNFSNIDQLLQNKLLKTLEEPPEHAYFILKVQNESKVLQTIKSRCQKINVPHLEKKELEEYLKTFGDGTKVDEAIQFCDGSVSKAEHYLKSENFITNVNFVFNMLQNLKKSWQIVDFASVLYAKKDEFADIMHIYLKTLQDAIYLVIGMQNKIGLTEHKTELNNIAQTFSLDAMSHMIKSTVLILEKLDRNCNYNTIIDEFLLDILEDKHKWPI